MKNNSDTKFSYQQLPVSLKLIYTILQVLDSMTQYQNWGKKLKDFSDLSLEVEHTE